MKFNLVIFFLSVFPLVLFGQVEERKAEQFKGVVLGMHSHDMEYDYSMLMTEIKELGPEWICLTTKFYQKDMWASEINLRQNDTAFWKQLSRTIAQAKEMDFKVLLFPIVLLEEAKEGEWRGAIKPDDLDLWFEQYNELMLSIGSFSEAHKVDMLSVGSEFCTMEPYTDRWYEIIELSRKVYSGKLTYSVNWDSIEGEHFFDALDIVGISSYFSLTKKENPTVTELVDAWSCVKDEILQIPVLKEVPFMFSEVGYTSQNGTNMHPWNRYLSDESDMQEQKDCFEAFNKVWLNEEELDGVFFYDWFGIGGEADLSYTFRFKPAVEEVKKWFVSE